MRSTASRLVSKLRDVGGVRLQKRRESFMENARDDFTSYIYEAAGLVNTLTSTGLRTLAPKAVRAWRRCQQLHSRLL